MNHSTEILIELYKKKDYSELDLFSKQQEALLFLEDNETIECLYGGAARGGKSVLGSRWKIMRRLSMPDSYGLTARSEYSKLEDTTLLTFFQELKNLGLKRDVDYKASGRPMTFTFPNGSREFFREIKYIPSDPEFDRLGSYDLTDAFLDEAQQIHWKAREVLRGRFSVTIAKDWKTIPKVLFTCNPAKTWVYSDFVLPSKKNQLTSDKKFIAALPSDNPYVPQSFFDNLNKADKVTKARLLHGDFDYDDDPSALCDYDAICDLFTNTHVKPGVKYISADLAMQGRDKFIAGSWSGLICTVDIDQAKSTGPSIERDLKDLKNSRGIGNTNIVADSDGLGAYLEGYIKNIKTFHGGASAINKKEFANIKSECGFKLAEVINNRELRIICTKEQEEEIKKEVSICLKRDNLFKDEQKKKIITKDKMKEFLGHSPDYMDMLLMRMIYEVKQIKTAIYW